MIERELLHNAELFNQDIDTSTAVRLGNAADELVPTINDEKDKSSVNAQDIITAQVCLAHIRYLSSQWKQVIEILEPLFSGSHSNSHPNTTNEAGAELNEVQGRCLLGSAYEKIGSSTQAITIYKTCQLNGGEDSWYPEIIRWRLRILARICIFSKLKFSSEQSLESFCNALTDFRSWANYCRNASPGDNWSIRSSSSWHMYHQLLSDILKSNVVYAENGNIPLCIGSESSPPSQQQRHLQFQELRTVENAYEECLMQETSFPKANERNERYEAFADQVIGNWNIIIHDQRTYNEPAWGGKSAYTREVLQMLYRAASKTFHSTSILRHLFTVHASIADFDLAMKAYNSYMQIVNKGRARAMKTGVKDDGMDNDDQILQTSAEAIKVLCFYGEIGEAEKAYGIGTDMKTFLMEAQQSHDQLASSHATSKLCKSESLAIAYRAIGQSRAVWSRYTPYPTTRPDLQQEAIEYYEKSVLHDPNDLESRYGLAQLQAETRLIGEAIQTVKSGIYSDLIETEQSQSKLRHFTSLRQQLPSLHLLVLLLTAKNDFDTAYQVCETTIADFINAARDCDRTWSVDLQDNLQVNKLPKCITHSLVDSEKQILIELLITEIELITILENMARAIEKCKELFSAFEQLFGHSQSDVDARSNVESNAVMPQAQNGTIKSFLGRSRSVRKTVNGNVSQSPQPGSLSISRSSTLLTTPEVEQITRFDDRFVGKEPREHHLSAEHKSLRSRLSMSLRKDRNRRSHEVTKALPIHQDDARGKRASSNSLSVLEDRANNYNDEHQHTLNNETIPQILNFDAHTPNNRVSSAILSTLQRNVHHTSILIKIWLFIANIYSKEDSYDDTDAAIAEALKLVQQLQSEVSKVDSSAQAWRNRGWGLGKSVSRLMADVCVEVFPSARYNVILLYTDVLL